MAELILDYYKNESSYSDGTDAEEEILNMVKSNAHKNPEQLLNASWPVFYHLSPLRENILNWYPFKKNCTILEVGSGCGAITGLLCKRAKSVVSVELTEKRANINFERHKGYHNLVIYAGNLENMRFNYKFDYIVVNGVLEYAGKFISGGNPYAKFLSILTSYLENDGIILLAIENRLGLKYFSGAKEDHLGKLFAGLNGYANTDIRTFSKGELTNIIHESSLIISKFYYPYPDYKIPEVIYTDEGYSKVPISYNVHSYDTDRYMFFDEIKLQRQLVKENICDIFANSFLVEIKKEENKKENPEDIIYLKINSNRDKKYKICTIIFKENNEVKVRKQALEPDAAEHLKKMHEFYKHHDAKNKYSLLPVKVSTDVLICDYLEFPTLESVLIEQVLIGNHGKYYELLDKFCKILSANGKSGKNLYTLEFHNIFGPEICPDDLVFTDFNNIDVLFDNVFFDNKKLIVSDYEWIADCELPILFIFWRSVNQFYIKNSYINEFIPREQVYSQFNITSNMESTFYDWEYYFSLNYVKMTNLERIQKKIISLSNVEHVFDNKYFTANVYIDRGNGFNDNEKYSQSYSIESQELNLTFDLDSFENIKSIRFDPIEGRLCKCKILSASINHKACGFIASNKFPFIFEEDLFLTTDPIYILNGTHEIKGKLDIHFTVEVIDENEIFPNIVKEIEAEIADKNLTIKNYLDLLQKYNDKLLQYNGIIKKYNILSKDYNNINAKHNEVINERDTLLGRYNELEKEYSIISKERDCLLKKAEGRNTDIKNLTNERNNLSEEKDCLLGRIGELNSDIKKLVTERDLVALEYESILNSASWKITKPIRMIMDLTKKSLHQLVNIAREIKKLFKKTYWNIKTYGLLKTVKKIFIKGRECLSNVTKSAVIAERVQVSDIWGKIDRWIDNTPHEFIDIFHVPMGWNTPLFQRFQHLSLQAGEVGGISIYGAHPLVDKDIDICEFVTPKLCLINLDNYEVKQKLFNILDKKKGLKFIRLQSIDLATTIEELESLISRGYKMVYEYIDEITPQIVGNIPQFVFERHEYILRNEIITVIATADKLFEQVKLYRNQNMALINNGVDYKHWNLKKGNIKCPKDIEEIVNQNKIIIGYHGALAQWIDYDLLKIIAENKRLIILLIGHEHDESLKNSKVTDYKNVYFIGAKPYIDLPRYAAFYDIAILPFAKNGVTKSVSPVKIFEYMALGKPIVTYSLPECEKYRSCLCADTREEFIEKIEYALDLRHDNNYLLQLKNEALGNTWESIMRRTVALVRENTENRQYCVNDLEPKISGDIKNIITSMGKDLLAFQSVYINQILRIPDKGNELVSITNKPYKVKKGDCKVIAYYLTQFHPDEHNEKWWGKGVTEWNNVCRAVPQFVGHYQPRIPGELGFYDLRIRENMARQIELAKMYGIYGFSFYYYWFDGIRLLEKPLEAFLSDKTLDFPFSLCWANENWTKRFDGTNLDILMEQPKSKESYCKVIHDMVRFLKDERYIKIGGKKLITVYRPDLMPEPAEVLKYWREFCREQEAGELYLVAVKVNMVDMNLLGLGYDAISEFHPGTLYTNCKNITKEIKFIRNNFGGEVFDYRDIVENQKYFRYNLPKLYRAVMPMWDNTARRNNKGMIFHGSTPSLYKKWLVDVIMDEKTRFDIDDIIVFVNAWNEWGEGAYLEPDKRFGYAYLEATKEAVEETR